MKLVLHFAIPLMFGNLFQQFYSMVDTVIVGRFLGTSALAAVGSTGSINFLIVGFCIGVCSGFSIPVAQSFGSKSFEDLRRFVGNILWLAVGFSLLFTVATLGICRGMQVLNVALGGTLYQDVHACGLTDAAHQQKPPYDVVRQRVDIAPGSVLDRVLCDGAGEGMVPGCKAGWPASLETSWEGLAPAPHSLLVNTMHHQAIACVADPLQVSAVSGDGLVEGLEDPSRRFYLGVQWHPEYLDDNVPLFEALVAAAK